MLALAAPLAVITLASPAYAQAGVAEAIVEDVRFLCSLRVPLTSPRPTIFTFTMGADDGLLADYSPVADALLARGWLSITLDLPAHGRDVRSGENRGGLFAWRQRTLAGEDWIGTFTAKVRAVIDHGVAAGYIDPRQIAIVGYSRGGFMALQTAAADPRITAVAAIQPVTDLLQLQEWQTFGSVPEAIASPLGIRTIVPALASRPVWFSIGWNDTRVGTKSMNDVVAAGRALEAPWTVMLHPERDGTHTFPATVYDQAALWLAAQRR